MGPQDADPSLFKAAMRRHAAAVCVVTTRHGGRDLGFTATAVCSLTVEPPRLAVFAEVRSETLPAVAASGEFAVNLLSVQQADVALACSTPDAREHRFRSGRWRKAGQGPPILDGAAYSLRCSLERTEAIGTHVLLVGRVSSVELADDAEPLLYRDRTWCRVQSLEQDKAA